MHLRDLIESVKRKSESERRRIAFMTSATATAIIALVWAIGLTTGGTLSFAATSLAQTADSARATATSAHANLAGAAAAFQSTSSAGGLTVVDSASSSSLSAGPSGNNTDQTSIPF